MFDGQVIYIIEKIASNNASTYDAIHLCDQLAIANAIGFN